MKFSGGTLLLCMGVATPLAVSAFRPTTTFHRPVVSSSRSLKKESRISRPLHPSLCKCPKCKRSIVPLFMSEVTEEAPPTDEATVDTPPEVVAMDGVASEEEAHNVDRPARPSGTSKRRPDKKKGTALADLEIGSTVEGTVKTITSYGAFMDIGAESDALCHVSRLSDDFVADVKDVVKVGEKLSVRIVNVDLEKKQVAVSARSEEAEANAAANRSGGGGGGRQKDRPRRSAGDREAQRAAMSALAEKGYDADKFVEGEVQNCLDFGAFVRFSINDFGEGLEGEIDGLVHISALAAGRVNKVSDVCKTGDKVQVRVKQVDPVGGKVSLSMISKDQEPEPRKKSSGRSQFSEDEMGAADWKESLEAFQADMPVFKNTAVVFDKRK